MEIVQALGIAAIAIVLLSVIYNSFNVGFNGWIGSINNNMETIFEQSSLGGGSGGSGGTGGSGGSGDGGENTPAECPIIYGARYGMWFGGCFIFNEDGTISGTDNDSITSATYTYENSNITANITYSDDTSEHLDMIVSSDGLIIDAESYVDEELFILSYFSDSLDNTSNSFVKFGEKYYAEDGTYLIFYENGSTITYDTNNEPTDTSDEGTCSYKGNYIHFMEQEFAPMGIVSSDGSTIRMGVDVALTLEE